MCSRPSAEPRSPSGRARCCASAAPTAVRSSPSRPTPSLLARCRERDGEAWNLLVARYERLVYSVARRNGLSDEDAADVTQGTFVTLIDSLSRIRDEERLASWLMTVTRRQAWRVRNLSRRDVHLEQAPEEVDDPFADWDSVVALHDALAEPGRHLPQVCWRRSTSSRRAPGYAEIAERFGRSIGGIGPLRGRCLEKLKAILTEDGGW
ncbi:sigma-70 family RNA polymerase sigma factor [Nocardioides sp. W3-2-3]|nr:sigma-70 family RNA polymerase sigma factor [Nocardioides convexus]